MTADVELMTLPDWMECLGEISAEEIRGYAHANVEASTKYYKDMLCQSQDDVMKLSAENEALRAEVERLQEIVRPKREEECLTLDHWRMRAYDLEANWSRCSRACADEQTKRIEAVAYAERLAEVLREIERHALFRGSGDLLQFVRAALHPTAAQEGE